MKIKIFVFIYVFLFSLVVYSTVLFEYKWNMYSFRSFKNYKDNTTRELINKNFDLESREDLFENIKECLEITHIFNSYCHNSMIANIFQTGFNNDETKQIFEKLKHDNSLYLLRLGYNHIGYNDNDVIALNTMESEIKASLIEKMILIRSLYSYYSKCQLDETKVKIQQFAISQWDNSEDVIENHFLEMLYYVFRDDVNQIYDGRKSKKGNILYGGENNQMPYYYSFVEMCVNFGNISAREDFFPNDRILNRYTITTQRDENTKQIVNSWYEKAYKDLILKKYILDADFIFYAFRSSKNEIMINIAREHIQNSDFKDARYKTVYYLVNHDFDYSFPILTNMVQDGSLHINEKKNFYRGLARLNKLPYSVLTKDQQQKANDYLKQQMHNEQDISIKLYIDFLLSICLDEYGLSDERTSFLNSLKEIGNLSQEDISQIDRRLKIIKYSIYTHSPSIFDSYVNGLTAEKPFIDVSKVDIHMLPVYEAEANGETWYYHDVNSEAYIATNTNKYKSLNLTIPQKLGIFPVVGITEGAFGSSWHSYTNIVIPKSVTYISYQAFAYNTNLLCIAIPNTVTNIGYSAFKRSNNISTIFLEEGSIFEDKHLYNDRDLTPNCKIIRTKFENGLPVIPPENGGDKESQIP